MIAPGKSGFKQSGKRKKTRSVPNERRRGKLEERMRLSLLGHYHRGYQRTSLEQNGLRGFGGRVWGREIERVQGKLDDLVCE
jgi:hypothetical protein